MDIIISDEAKRLGYTQQLFEKAIVSEGNTARLAKLMERAEKGEKLTYVTLGGSITAGSTTTEHQYCYSYRVYRWWVENFPKAEFSYNDMGIGATGSVLGVHRLKSDVLDKNPDFLVVEFAVNDNEKLYPYYECIIRRVLEKKPDTAIIMLFMQQQVGWNVQETQIPIGKHYELPMISYRDATNPLLTEGKINWADISPDDIHPNDLGHSMVACLIKSYLDCVKECYKELPKGFDTALPQALYGAKYMNATLYTGSVITADVNEGWIVDNDYNFYHLRGCWDTDKVGAKLSFKLKFKEFNLAYFKVVDEAMLGKFTVEIDGKEVATFDNNAIGTWGDHWDFAEVASCETEAEHTVTFICTEGWVRVCGLMVS